MFNHMESRGGDVRWPQVLATAPIALIPKGEGHEPIKQRPITLFSLLYRLYTSLRYEDTEDWQEKWAPLEVYGAREGVDALDATWEVALEVEEAYLGEEDIVAALLDNSKYFDFFPEERSFSPPPCAGRAPWAHPRYEGFLRPSNKVL